MKFLVYRTSQGMVSKAAPCPEAERGDESPAWPGEYSWTVEIADLAALLSFLHEQGGGLGLFVAEEGEAHPCLEIFDDADDDA